HFFEEDRPLGTGGGIRLIKNEIHGTFILTNCDILILDDVKKMLDHHMEQKNRVTMVCSLKNYEIPYGIVKFDAGGEIKDFEEKPQMSFFVNTGYYILEPDIFDYVGEDECITMPDIIARMKEDHQKIGMYPIGENAWLDMGEMDTLDHMEKRIKEMDVF
ncbi:MAG TPA: nucleotidyltransferase, partial [Lachnospiraceae bacterium]|nr:nucleotidyltransferase [Lachnospiraceae bacterium]